MLYKKRFIVSCALFCFIPQSAFAGVYSCPEFLHTSEVTEKLDSSWRLLSSKQEYTFSHSVLSDGHPDQQVFLRPRAEKEVIIDKLPVKKWVYNISDRGEGSQFYLTCHYNGSKATLTKSLEASIKTCEQTDGKPAPDNISCY